MDFKKHPAVHGQLDAAKDEVLERVNKALNDAGLFDFHVESIGLYYKQLLPNYQVFDEERYFTPGHDPGPLFTVGGVRVGSGWVR